MALTFHVPTRRAPHINRKNLIKSRQKRVGVRRRTHLNKENYLFLKQLGFKIRND